MEALLDSKNEYTSHICDLLTSYISSRFLSLYGNAKNLKHFQKLLSNIKQWNASIVEEEYEKLQSKIKCNYLHKLVKTILMSSLKIKLYDLKNNINNIKVKIPSIDNFFHKCLQQAAIYFWKHPYLFYTNLKPIERQHNLNLIELYVQKAIKKTLINSLPMDDIINNIDINNKPNEDDNLDNVVDNNILDDEDDEDDEDDDDEDEDEEDVEEDEDDVEEDEEDEDDDNSDDDNIIDEVKAVVIKPVEEVKVIVASESVEEVKAVLIKPVEEVKVIEEVVALEPIEEIKPVVASEPIEIVQKDIKRININKFF